MDYQTNPINITAIDHVVIRVLDLPKMIAFYQDVLGCRLERGPSQFGLVQLRAGQSLIDLLDANNNKGGQSGRAPDCSAPNMDHFCLRIVPWSEDAILAHLKKFGVEHGPIENRYGADGQGPSLYLRDPEGNSVELKG